MLPFLLGVGGGGGRGLDFFIHVQAGRPSNKSPAAPIKSRTRNPLLETGETTLRASQEVQDEIIKKKSRKQERNEEEKNRRGNRNWTCVRASIF